LKQIKNILIYGFTAVASRFAPLILLPIYANYLTIEDFGIFELGITTFTILLIFSDWQLLSSVMREYYEDVDKGKLIGNTLFSYLILSVIIFLLWLTFQEILSDFLPHNLWIWIIATILPSNIFQLALLLFRLEQKPVYFLLISLSQVSIQIFLSLYLLNNWKTSPEVGLIAIFGSYIITTMPILIGFYKNFTLGYDYNLFRRMLSFSTPLIPAVMGTWAKTYYSKIFLYQNATLSKIAIFSTLDKIASLMLLAVLIFKMAFEPSQLKALKSGNKNGEIQNSLNYYIGIILLAFLFGIFLAPFILKHAFPIEYHKGAYLIPFIMLAHAIDGLFLFFSLSMAWQRKTKLISLFTLISIFSNITFMYLLYPILDMDGLVLSIIIAAFIKSSLFYVWHKKNTDISFSIWKIILFLVLILALSIFGAVFSKQIIP
jgi:O-antigen/teichoic acid export membrane protein